MKNSHTRNKNGTDDAMDWLTDGASKASVDSLNPGLEPKPATGLPMVLRKINLVTSLAALVLFFLPWIDIQCSGKSMATQTGVQIIYGGGSPAQDMEAFGEESKQSGGTGDESMGFAPLVALAFLSVAAAVVVAFLAIRHTVQLWQNLAGVLCAVALGLLALQMMIGFPVKKKLGEELAAQNKTGQQAGDPFAGVGESMAQAMMMQIQIRHLPSLYLMLAVLGIPSLILANGWIDRMKKS